MQNQRRYVWNERKGKYVWVGGSESKEKGKTGTGVQSTGKRSRCKMDECPAFASPSKSGFCSFHESQITPVGELVGDAAKFKCKETTCLNAVEPDGEHEYCKECAERRMRNAHDWDAEPDPDILFEEEWRKRKP